MADIIKLKRTSTPGNVPSTSALQPGEIALNINDGKLFFKKTTGGADSIVTLSNDYSSLINTPTSLSQFTNDTNYITLNSLSYQSGSPGYDSSTGTITIPSDLSQLTDNNGTIANAVANVTGSAIIRTFNLIGQFNAPITGSAIFVPLSSSTVKSVQLTNGTTITQNLVVGLNINSVLTQVFSLPVGLQYTKTTITPININENDQITVDVLSGSGYNFSLSLLNIS